MIRQASIDDQEKVCDLILMAASVLFEDITQSNDLAVHKELLKKYYVLPDNKFSHENILVYEHEDSIAGCVVFYETSKEPLYNKNMKNISKTYTFDLEGVPGTIYIDSIAVKEEYQGLGISKKLFNYIFKHYEQDLSLLVEQHKETTKAYYERLGFENQGLKILFNAPVYEMIRSHRKEEQLKEDQQLESQSSKKQFKKPQSQEKYSSENQKDR
jgi:ribosomal protein S18 acetylase RimI-like enzyme